MPIEEHGVEVTQMPEIGRGYDTPTIEDSRRIVEDVKENGTVISLTRVGANPMLRYTPYRNNRGTKVGMWSCISYYFDAMPERTLLNSPHIVRPWKLDDWEVNLITTPWVVNQVSKTRWGELDILPVDESPFGGRILEWETSQEGRPE